MTCFSSRFSLELSLGALALAPLLGGCFSSGTGGVGGHNEGAGGAGGACVPEATCTLDKSCLATVSNAGATRLGFRIAQISVTRPEVLSKGLFKVLIDELFMPALPACLSSNPGTTSWLIALDTAAGTLRTGEAAPGAAPPQGYAFHDDTVTVAGNPIHVAPVTFPLVKDTNGLWRSTTPGDLNMQLFWPPSTSALHPQAEPGVLPFHGFSMHDIRLSSAQSCIGHYTPASRDPTSNCSSGDLFSPDGALDAYISLEEADKLPFSTLEESLCLVLTGDTGSWSDGKSPARCRRTQGVIDFQGDWCAATNAAADASCHDAVHVHALFAASAVAVQP